MTATKPRKPRLNHVAMSMPADALDDDGRAALTPTSTATCSGGMEYDMLTQDRRRLVLRVHSDEQFVFLIADDSPMAAPRWTTSACRSARSTSSSRSTSW